MTGLRKSLFEKASYVYVPDGYTENQVLEIISSTVKALAPSFVFGIYDEEDLQQEGTIFALELLAKRTYDPARPLANYLFVHIRRRMLNIYRNKCRRNDPPCAKCHRGENCEPGGCKKYAEWLGRNNAKANIMRPLGIEHISDEHEPSVHEDSTVETDASINECLEKIDRLLPVELRSTYLRLREVASVPKAKRLEVEFAIKELLQEDFECQ